MPQFYYIQRLYFFTLQRLKLVFLSDFHEKFINCFSRLLEFKSVGIFAISFFDTEIKWYFFIFVFFNNLRLPYVKTNIVNFLQYVPNPTWNNWNFRDICTIQYKQFNVRIFNSAPYSVFKNVDLKKVFCTQRNVKILI